LPSTEAPQARQHRQRITNIITHRKKKTIESRGFKERAVQHTKWVGRKGTFLDDEFGLTSKQLLLVNAGQEQGKKTGAGGNKVRPKRENKKQVLG
jgi:hypothetical protein